MTSKIKINGKEYERPTIWINGKSVKVYRYIMEQHLGRKLSPFEIIHHIDEDPSNNAIENLQIMTREQHTSLHSAGKRRVKQNKG